MLEARWLSHGVNPLMVEVHELGPGSGSLTLHLLPCRESSVTGT